MQFLRVYGSICLLVVTTCIIHAWVTPAEEGRVSVVCYFDSYALPGLSAATGVHLVPQHQAHRYFPKSNAAEHVTDVTYVPVGAQCPPAPREYGWVYSIGRTMFETDRLPGLFVTR